MVKYNEGKYVCTLSPELQERAKEELNEDPARRAKDIEILRQWIIKQPHIIGRTDDAFLLRFLRCGKFSIEKAKERIETHYTIKNAVPEWFTPIDLNEPMFQKLVKLGLYLPLGYDKEGRRVAMGRLCHYDPSEYKLDDVLRLNFMVTQILHWDEQTQICGTVYITDMNKLSGGHMAQMTPFVVKKMTACFQDSQPIRIKGLHFWKTSSIFDTLFSVAKIFLKDKLLRRVHNHGSNLESLHAAIPPEILPKEYGGSAGDIETITSNLLKELKENQAFFFDDAKYKVDESKRPGKPKTHEDLFGIDGTFRKLNID